MDFREVGASVLEFGTMELGCLGDTPRSWPETPAIMSHGSWCCVSAVSLLTLVHHQYWNKQKWCCGKMGFITSWEDVTVCNQVLWSPQGTVLGWRRPLLHSLLIPYAIEHK